MGLPQRRRWYDSRNRQVGGWTTGACRADQQRVGAAGEPTLRDGTDALIAVYGADFGIHSPTWISRFTDMTRQIGEVSAPTAVLIRPDGYVAWLGDLPQVGLADALTTWFGAPSAA